MIKRWMAAVVMAVLAAGNVGAQTNVPAAKPEKLVMCWYMVCFGSAVERNKQEMELAQRHGIDGFLLDMGGWGDADNGYVKNAANLFEAAKQLGTGFKLALAPEYLVSPFEKHVPDMVMKFKDHPNYLKQDGRPVLGTYVGLDHPGYLPALKALEAKGVKVFLIPDAGLNSRPRALYNPSYETFERLFETPVGQYMDGLMMFQAEQLGNHISANALGRRVTQKSGKLFAAGVIPNYNSANLQDYRGLSGYLDQWEGAVNDGADWISLVIWNDFNEDSALMPSRWPAGYERYLFSRDESYLDATAYASAWFKAGRRPEITQDKMFVTYRNRSQWLRKAWDYKTKKWVDACLNNSSFDQIHDDNADLVYVDTFLTAPASLTVRLGGKLQKFELPAGVGHASVPLVPGTPRLTLERGGKVLAETLGRRQILGPADLNERNSLQVRCHHLFRTWAGGTAIGPVVKRLEAEAGTLGAEAKVVEEGKVKAVAAKGSDAALPVDGKYKEEVSAPVRTSPASITLPVEGLATATYNVRVIYRNPGPGEARLTFSADGAGLPEKDYPWFIPVWLPPTEGDKYETASFFFSLYSGTRTLKLQWLPGRYWFDSTPGFMDDDYGSALIDAVELVKVEPVVLPRAKPSLLPDLVPIPGGKFTMGSGAGEPDEQPRHAVNVSGFAMGKYEVTNEEFERFDPTHRAFRNGNSWRDREPVVHVSWVEAAKYCNWLSEKAGLTPVYAEKAPDAAKPDSKFWMADLKADGFRLPTEAEWEYVATGRGEDRKYPWGNEEPVPGLHGRFLLKAALGARLPRPASEEDGAVVVGSYPAGTSRDGVLDLAGNVGEWCTDWYTYPYPAEKQTDPCNQTPGNYRSIRGGTWSWYGNSQRATDREFNSQNYPGHAYYGFRLVVSEAGWKKIKKGDGK